MNENMSLYIFDQCWIMVSWSLRSLGLHSKFSPYLEPDTHAVYQTYAKLSKELFKLFFKQAFI